MQVRHLDGRGGEIRTPDPHNPIVVRYQAALRPDRFCAGLEWRRESIEQTSPGVAPGGTIIPTSAPQDLQDLFKFES